MLAMTYRGPYRIRVIDKPVTEIEHPCWTDEEGGGRGPGRRGLDRLVAIAPPPLARPPHRPRRASRDQL
ncbi:hypothetical protein OOT46_26740 [Aquabacterium sp. A7-Y]|uniref:hypothetical protein n=1 Tax=Aquabacterium sp. A7-Y TaxID=1349605 RepID=UPI00223DA72B|nr:hypothetical protein [Aquabacterium sp. A7-Y]MCW7541414.1 hypothetical protein [Aquabacterium sp. A7-Y]